MTEGYRHIVVIGLGLIGSSLAHSIRRHESDVTIVGYDHSADVCRRAEDLGFCDRIVADAGEAVTGADLVLLCVPVGAMGKVFQAIAAHLGEECVVSDTGSVKSRVVKAVSPHIPSGVHFIPGHPVAGTEKSGPDAGFAELFDGRWCILTPLPHTRKDVLERFCRFWRGCGAKVTFMDTEHHDLVLAITSHVPHLIAFSIVDTAAGLENVRRSEVIRYSAGGFRDFTRIASSDVVMWRDVFLHNRDAVVEMLACFSRDLDSLRDAIVRGDGGYLEEAIRRAQGIRERILEAGEDSAVVDFGRHVICQRT